MAQSEKDDVKMLVYDATGDEKCDLIGIHGSNIKIDNSTATKHGGKEWNSIFSSKLYKSGIIKYQIRVIQVNHAMVIGFCQHNNMPNNYFWRLESNIYYTIDNESQKQSYYTREWQHWNSDNSNHNSNNNCGFKNGDLVTIELNLIKRKITIWINDELKGIAFENIAIPNNENQHNVNDNDNGNNNSFLGYRLAIGLYDYGDSVKIEKYWEIDENNNENGLKLQIENDMKLIESLLKKWNEKIDHLSKKVNCNENENDKFNPKTQYIGEKNENNYHKELSINDLTEMTNSMEIFHSYKENIQLSINTLDKSVLILGNQIDKVLNNMANTKKYKEWNVNGIILWIGSLENGRFKKYCHTLRKKFQTNEIKGSDLPDISRTDLHISFGINNFRDRVDIEKHFKNLSNCNNDD